MNAATEHSHYYVPHGTYWPILGSIGLFSIVLGVSMEFNGMGSGAWISVFGAAVLAVMLFGWFGSVIAESQKGLYNDQVDKSFRWAMAWFIFSEVVFFGAFFGALFYARQLIVPWLAGEGNNFYTNLLLWEGFENAWPSAGPAGPRTFETIPAWGVPALNTAILLTSGVTLTIAHHMLRANKRVGTAVWLAVTVLLGFVFLGFQAEEYVHAYTDLGLRLDTAGIYGSTFFMLTGFHGLHVLLGAVMLLVIWLRVLRGHFSPERHFAFEAAAWYWHFVDVVWLGLFIFVYWL